MGSDGLSRFECTSATRTYEGTADTLTAFVVSLNLHRRHLSESQRAAVAAKLANLDAGDNQHKSGPANLPDHGVSQAQAAEMLNVSERSVRSAAKVKDEAPIVFEQVERGLISVNLAAQTAENLRDCAGIAAAPGNTSCWFCPPRRYGGTRRRRIRSPPC